MGILLETLWELQCLKTRSELTGEIKRRFMKNAKELLRWL